jgi:hypothetical protein
MDTPVVVHPPGPGGRRVTIRGQDVGRAGSAADLLEFLRRAGLDDLAETDLLGPDLVEWRGAAPGVWE